MTDYTPAPETPAEKSLKFTDRKFAKLVREASRLQEERDELLEALTWIVDQVDRFGGITIENNHSIFEKFRAIIKKVEK